MRKFWMAAGLAVAVLLPNLAAAQSEEVVVTAERRNEEAGEPHVFMVKRADHLIARLRVTCDTRDERQRKDEIKTTLRAMIRAAGGSKTISLATGDDVLTDLSESDFDDLIVPDARPDSSQITVVIKTAVAQGDTFNAATGRIKAFVEGTAKTGRTEVLREGRWDLTLIAPDQYRDGLIAKIVGDAKHTAELFGPGYGVVIDGLERPITWSQKGPLDLALYIPYVLHIAPPH
ncbi:MAG TPA: hypothetical protein VGF56_03550 [Rhizomicrobium sp.]|jgi:hypothetical protein